MEVGGPRRVARRVEEERPGRLRVKEEGRDITSNNEGWGVGRGG